MVVYLHLQPDRGYITVPKEVITMFELWKQAVQFLTSKTDKAVPYLLVAVLFLVVYSYIRIIAAIGLTYMILKRLPGALEYIAARQEEKVDKQTFPFTKIAVCPAGYIPVGIIFCLDTSNIHLRFCTHNCNFRYLKGIITQIYPDNFHIFCVPILF